MECQRWLFHPCNIVTAVKRQEALTFGQIFDQAIRQAGLEPAYDEQRASYLWPEIVGPTVNRLTTRRYVDNGVLHVYISSAPLKSELSFLTADLIKRINETLGKDVIKSIVIH